MKNLNSRSTALVAGSVLLALGVASAGVAVFGGSGSSGDAARPNTAALSGEHTAIQPSAEPTTSPTAEPKKAEPSATETKKQSPERVRTTTVTETTAASDGAGDADEPAEPAAGKKTGAEEKAEKAEPAAKQAKATTQVRSVGVIRNSFSGMCVDLPYYGAVDEGSQVTQFECRPGDGDNQMYETVSRGGDAFLIRNQKSNWCLDVDGLGAAPAGSNVKARTCAFGSADNQMFRKQSQGGGFYLVNVKSGLCLDVSDADNANRRADQPLTLWRCSPDNDHVWTFGQ
nr:RICIN domain-containing protein [Kineosporia babensis]